MAPSSKADKKAAVDAAAWMFNVVTSVGIIIVNKALMATYGFSFATTLTGLHFATTTLMTAVLRMLGYIQPSHLPIPELLKFILFANFSIVGMNVSLMWNSVGFYQIAKLSMIPVSCLLEVVFDKVRYSRDTKLSILVVLLGVAVCTITDVSVNTKGFIAAAIAVWSTALQQYYVHYLQRKYSLSSFNLLGHTAPAQAASLLLLGPFLDYWLTNKRIDAFEFNLPSTVFLILSCTIAVGTNLSQFICIGRFTAVSFQVLGHMKTILVLILGFLFFGKEGLSIQVVIGMVIAVVGMMWYGNASSKPGGKERLSSPGLLFSTKSKTASCRRRRMAAALDGGEGRSSAAVVVVGVNLDSRCRELLTWALVKVAKIGDCVIALHVADPNADKTSLISLVKNFDSLLAAYEGFCHLKQVDLKLKVCRGSPVHKFLPQEAKSCGATCLILGASEIHHKLKSRISVAKYCAKNLQKNISVICVDNGKIVFERESNVSNALDSCSVPVASGSRFKRRKTLPKSSLSLPPEKLLSSSPTCESDNIPMALVPVKTHEMNKLGRWALLSRVLLQGPKLPQSSSTKKRSLKQRILPPASKQSVAAIYPDKKLIINSSDKPESDLDEKGGVAPNPGGNAFSKISKDKLKDIVNKHSITCQLFEYQELLSATDSFASDNLIGKGGSSRVYRGSLPGSKEVAVKVLKPSEDVVEQFVPEIEIITTLHHNNIVSLVGFCCDEDNLLLLYNLLSRGSLEENLHGDKTSEYLLSWDERYKIALGVAEALNYLHSLTEPIIHRDVKSSNILLSDSFEPQLSDFGLATLASSYIHHLNVLPDVAGTFGYLAPEYFMEGELDEKIDVYAFGVVLLELLSGRKPIDNGQPKGHESLVMWAKHIVRECKFSDLKDPKLTTTFEQSQFDSMVLAATLCIRESPQSRPKTSIILKLLKGDPEAVEWARQETNNFEDSKFITGENSTKDIQYILNLALLNLEDDSVSSSSTEQNISVEDYLGGRYSRCSSFD